MGVAAIAGALVTAFIIAPHGWVLAFLAAPFGGSFVALVVAIGVAEGRRLLAARNRRKK